ncbi:MAG: DUF4229 domain-containing protein [Nocardioidaceae bacterium]|nr:DUF4229 domain-containing protein [Nocardioidaceae bacterium]
MKIFALYTAARALLFLVAYGVLWLVFGRWLEWGAATGLWTAFIAMIISSVVALLALRSLRESLAVEVAARAERAKKAFDARRRGEDGDLS